MKVEVPLADVVDKVTILRIKLDKIGTDNVRHELQALLDSWSVAEQPPMRSLQQYRRLAEVNTELWRVEEELRRCEAESRFDGHFVELARSVYGLNDERAALKRAINAELGSDLIEEKSYR